MKFYKNHLGKIPPLPTRGLRATATPTIKGREQAIEYKPAIERFVDTFRADKTLRVQADQRY